MSGITTKLIPDENKTIIEINGRLTFDLYKSFSSLLDTLDTSEHLYLIDLENTEELNIAGLAMLLIMKDRIDSLNSRISIYQSNNSKVDRIISVANMRNRISFVARENSVYKPDTYSERAYA